MAGTKTLLLRCYCLSLIDGVDIVVIVGASIGDGGFEGLVVFGKIICGS
jgi:hypothetical protein